MSEADRSVYISREYSWLQFNQRVLMLSCNESVPLLERLNFLNIYYSNLDGFFMTRVGRLINIRRYGEEFLTGKMYSRLQKHLTSEQEAKACYDVYYNAFHEAYGWNENKINEELAMIRKEILRQQKMANRILKDILKELSKERIEVISFENLDCEREKALRKLFIKLVPVLVASIYEGKGKFPFLRNCETYVAARIPGSDVDKIGIINLDRVLPYCIMEGEGITEVVITSELVRYFAPMMFGKKNVAESCIIRITRNGDVPLELFGKGLKKDFRSNIKGIIEKRKREIPIRLQISKHASDTLSGMILDKLKLRSCDLYVCEVPVDQSFGKELKNRENLRYVPQRPVRAVNIHKGEYFDYLSRKDILLSYPYHSFTQFIELLYEAADTSEVTEIHITMYRLAQNSKLAAALAYASERGKKVHCLLELKARFDEQNNIDYSELLERAGCSIFYGVPSMKVHSKLCLICIGTEEDRRYITQLGTGNYNEHTSEEYSDLSFISSSYEMGRAAQNIFANLEREEIPEETDFLWVAPNSFKDRLLELLDREIGKGDQGHVIIKVNSLNDQDVMDKLIECSRSGVRVELFIRGICCLRPQVPGYTDNIYVKSIVGRYLEHSRIFVFGDNEEQRIFIGSGDLLVRNTQRRVETFVELKDPDICSWLITIIELMRQDDTFGWVMNSNGEYDKPVGVNTDCQRMIYYKSIDRRAF